VVGDPEDPRTDIMEGYDGSPWEYYANPGFVLRTVGHAAGATRRGAYLDWRLGELRSHGSTVTRGADAEIGGRAAYRLVVTARDGFARDYFIDQENFLLLADRYHAPVHAFGTAVTTEARFADWREVAGILFPFRAVEVDLATGRELNSMAWGKIEVNRELPLSWFAPPPPARSRLQALLEKLYEARTDATQVLWSYADFREAYPDVDTREGVEAIGYQILKTGAHDTAIALLEGNARDYPRAASAAFALGRALATKGDTARARKELERALTLDPTHKRADEELKRLRP
jgi:tetratricopeptide (TPR) repeat protein